MLSSQAIDRIIAGVIKREGGYSNHPMDPGGETKYGISKRAYPEEDIKNLTFARAADIYRRDYVEKFRLNELDSDRTAELVVDWVVHSGSLGIRRLQSCLGLVTDGIVGEKTLQKLNALEDPNVILRWRLEFLVGLTGHPFIKGWVRRLVELGL